MDTLREGTFLYLLTCLTVPNNDGGIVIDANVYADSVVTRELDDGVICSNGENENRCTILNLHQRQGNFPLTEAGIIEIEK